MTTDSFTAVFQTMLYCLPARPCDFAQPAHEFDLAHCCPFSTVGICFGQLALCKGSLQLKV